MRATKAFGEADGRVEALGEAAQRALAILRRVGSVHIRIRADRAEEFAKLLEALLLP
jgi:hypothetical protein